MKIAVLLENAPDCELDRAEKEFTDEADIGGWVHDTIADWGLKAGDTIKIREV